MTSAVVTGAAHGIGAACVRTLVQRGFDVIACDVEPLPDSVLDALDAPDAPDAPDGPAVRGRVWSMTVDVAAADAPQRIADEVAARCGELDLLVNNAGIGAEGHFADLPRSQWQRVMDVSLTAPFLLTQALWPYLRKPGGAVVNVSSIHGQRPLPEQAAYAAAKGGLENLTRALAVDAAPHGVRVNAVAPGFTRTRRWDEWMGASGEQAEWNRREVARLIPWGAPGEPDDVAETIAWLGTPDGLPLTGAVVPVDGGLGALAFARLQYDDVNRTCVEGEPPA